MFAKGGLLTFAVASLALSFAKASPLIDRRQLSSDDSDFKCVIIHTVTVPVPVSRSAILASSPHSTSLHDVSVSALPTGVWDITPLPFPSLRPTAFSTSSAASPLEGGVTLPPRTTGSGAVSTVRSGPTGTGDPNFSWPLTSTWTPPRTTGSGAITITPSGPTGTGDPNFPPRPTGTGDPNFSWPLTTQDYPSVPPRPMGTGDPNSSRPLAGLAGVAGLHPSPTMPWFNTVDKQPPCTVTATVTRRHP